MLSVSDLRSVGLDGQLFERLYMPVGRFLELARASNPSKPQAPVTSRLNDTLSEVRCVSSAPLRRLTGTATAHELWLAPRLRRGRSRLPRWRCQPHGHP